MKNCTGLRAATLVPDGAQGENVFHSEAILFCGFFRRKMD